MEEILKQIVEELNNITKTQTYDWLILAVSLTSIILSFMIFRRQTKISEKQTDIMEQQNKIALYQERYKVYLNISKLLSLTEELRKIAFSDKLIDIKIEIINILLTQFAIQNQNKPAKKTMYLHIVQQEISCGEFLFSNGKEIAIFAQSTIGYFRKLIYRDVLFTPEELKELKQIISTMEKFSLNEFDTIKNELSLTK